MSAYFDLAAALDEIAATRGATDKSPAGAVDASQVVAVWTKSSGIYKEAILYIAIKEAGVMEYKVYFNSLDDGRSTNGCPEQMEAQNRAVEELARRVQKAMTL